MAIKESLLRQARRFDEMALAEIYDQYSPELFRYAFRLLQDSDKAEECVAETFSRFLHALHRGGGPREYLRAYLYRVAHNLITDSFRRQPPPAFPLDSEILLKSDSNPPKIVEEKLVAEKVLAALRLLTDDQRQVIMLKFLEGWSNEEVALVLGKSIGAVKSLQYRALASLKRILIKNQEVIL